MINWKLISTLLAEEFYQSSLGGFYNEDYLKRIWFAHFEFEPKLFHDEKIMYGNQAIFYDYFMTLASIEFKSEKERVHDILNLLNSIVGEFDLVIVNSIFKKGGYYTELEYESEILKYSQIYNFHKEVVKHSQELFKQEHYSLAINEVCKAYIHSVQHLSGEHSLDGEKLMLKVFGENGVLKVTSHDSESDRNIEEGMKFLSAGIIRMFRNPTSHTPVKELIISKYDSLEILGLMSFLFKNLEKVKK